PRDAVMPFTIMGGAYLLAVTVPVTVVEWRRLRAISAAATTIGSAQHDLPTSRPVAEDKP
ncbi:MAG: hypothetical protein KY452_09905, partial [Actinobacteria bacterium]|nr:hypothetical protein [Actinomycetota bacterium]